MIFAKPWEYLWGSWHWHYSFRRARGRRLTSGEAHVRNLDGLPRLKEGNCHGTSLQFLRIIVYCIVLYYCNLGEFKCLFLQNFPFEVELGQQVDCIHNIKPFSSVWGGRKFFRHRWVASWDCLTTYTLLRHHKNISFKQFVSILLLNFGGCGLRYVLRRLRVAMPSEFLPQLGHVVGFQLEYLTHLCKDEWSVFIPLLNFRVMVIPRAHAKDFSQNIVPVRDWNKDFNWHLSGISLHSQIHSSFCRIKPAWSLILDVYQIHIDLPSHIIASPLLSFWFSLFVCLSFSLVHSSQLCGQTSGYIFLYCRVFWGWPGCSVLSLFTSLLSSLASCD